MNRLAKLLGVAFLACGPGGGSPDGGNDAGPVDAGMTTFTLTGARSSTFTGSAPNALYTPAVNRGEVVVLVGTSIEETAFDFMFDGEPMSSTYVGNDDAGITCNVYDTLDGGLDGWMANRGGGIPDFGECSLSLSSVSLKADVGTQKKYVVHGSVTATLPARSGNATGTINYSASF
jgi:hypothetical protein